MKFTKHANHRKVRIKEAYRRPRGLHNKMRLEKKGHRPPVKQGYMTDGSTKGLRKGLTINRVYNLADLQGLDPKTDGVMIGKVGAKKKIQLLQAIEKANITLLTGDPKQQREALETAYQQRKKLSEELEKERQAKQDAREEAAKKAAEEEKPSEEATEEKLEEKLEDDEKKQKEQQEKEKVLTKAR